jgi:hypothetical protein
MINLKIQSCKFELEEAHVLRVKALPDSNRNSVRRRSARLIIGRWIQNKHLLLRTIVVLKIRRKAGNNVILSLHLLFSCLRCESRSCSVHHIIVTWLVLFL